MTDLAPLLGLPMLATLINRLAEHYLPASLDEYIPLVDGALGIAAAAAFGLDAFGTVGLHTAVPLVGEIATGLLIGGGATLVGDFVGQWTQPSPAEALANLMRPPQAPPKP